MTEIRYVKHAIANNFGDYIELHEGLKEFPKLHSDIIKHEFGHTKNPAFTKHDFFLDLEMPYNWKDMFKFMIKYPSSLYQILPFYYKDKKFIYDKNMIVIWTSIVGVIGAVIYWALRL